MHKQQFQGLGLVALSCIGLGIGAVPAEAASPFGQRDVDQSKYAVIAMPIARGGYKLLVVEQVSDKRDCWAESGKAPTVVDPLLVTFDFTGICGRSTDSNGYSIRVEQRDMGMDYRLSIEQQGNELFLTGVRNRGAGEAKMVIGRTNGIVPGAFMKFYLEPNWRLTRRTFEERTLGHVYFTSDSMQAAFNTPMAAPTVAPLNPAPVPATGSVVPPAGQPSAAEPPAVNSNVVEVAPMEGITPAQAPQPKLESEASPASNVTSSQAKAINTPQDPTIQERINRARPPRSMTR